MYLILGVHEIASIDEGDIGEYTCESPGIHPVHVKLQISPGEYTCESLGIHPVHEIS